MPLRVLDGVCAMLGRAFMVVAVAVFAAVVGMNGMEIAARTFFRHSFPWIYETNLLFASWVYFLGIFLVYRRSGDIAMIGLVSLLSTRGRRLHDLVVQVLTAVVFAALAWYGWLLVELQLPFRSPGVGFPRAAFTAPLVIGAVAIAIDAARRMFGGEPGRSGDGDAGETA